MKLFSLLAILLFINVIKTPGYGALQQSKHVPVEKNTPCAADTIVYKIIKNPDAGYGYDIYVKGRLLIHQPSIPGNKGNNGFRKSEDARKVAGLVAAKIRKGIMPPSVTREEMERLGIRF